MSDYGYSRGGRMGGRFQSWAIAGDRADSTDGWNRSGFLSRADARGDHVCRPVIVGDDGRATPGVIECPPDHRKNGFIGKIEKVEAKEYRIHPATSAYTVDRSGGRVQEFFSNVQNAASEGRSGMGFPGSMFQRKAGRSIYSGYDGPNDMISSRLGPTEPTVITEGGWVRPTRNGWALPPDEPLGSVTNDIGAAAEYLRGSARPTPATNFGEDRRSPVLAPAYQARKQESAAEASIDSREAAKRYGASIDSREAAKRYGGQFIW